MGEARKIKPRKCEKCQQTKDCTAAELKEHYAKCKGDLNAAKST